MNKNVENKELMSATDNNFETPGNFEHAQRVAKMFSQSDLIPAQYRNNLPNTMIAMEMANRIGANPLMVMQNLYIVQGKPSWSSSFIIAALNACNKFSPLRFEIDGEGDSLKCRAWAVEIDTKERLDGPWVSIDMAKAEGWFNKTGSKWKTMPELMIRYRAAAFFGRLYAPEILMGLHTSEEVMDMNPVLKTEIIETKENERIISFINNATKRDDLNDLDGLVLTPYQTELFNTKIAEFDAQ